MRYGERDPAALAGVDQALLQQRVPGRRQRLRGPSEQFGHQNDLPDQRESRPRGGRDIGRQLRQYNVPQRPPARYSKHRRHFVKRRVEHTGYATSWPGGLPTQTDLTSAHARAFIVASTVKKIEISKQSRQTQVSCKLEIRVAPWSGSDGGEHWEANKSASASGSAKAMTGSSDREIAGGVRDCLEAVAEDVTDRQILPFLKRLTTAGS